MALPAATFNTSKYQAEDVVAPAATFDVAPATSEATSLLFSGAKLGDYVALGESLLEEKKRTGESSSSTSPAKTTAWARKKPLEAVASDLGYESAEDLERATAAAVEAQEAARKAQEEADRARLEADTDALCLGGIVAMLREPGNGRIARAIVEQLEAGTYPDADLQACWPRVRNAPEVLAAVADIPVLEEAERARTCQERLQALAAILQGHPARIAELDGEAARLRAYIRERLPKEPEGLAFLEAASNAAVDFFARGGGVGLVVAKLTGTELPPGTLERTAWIRETYRRLWGVDPTAGELAYLDAGDHKTGPFGGGQPFTAKASLLKLMLERPPPADFVPLAESVVPEVNRLIVVARERAALAAELKDARTQLDRLRLRSHPDRELQACFDALQPTPPPPPAAPAGGGLLAVLAALLMFF